MRRGARRGQHGTALDPEQARAAATAAAAERIARHLRRRLPEGLARGEQELTIRDERTEEHEQDAWSQDTQLTHRHSAGAARGAKLKKVLVYTYGTNLLSYCIHRPLPVFHYPHRIPLESTRAPTGHNSLSVSHTVTRAVHTNEKTGVQNSHGDGHGTMPLHLIHSLLFQ